MTPLGFQIGARTLATIPRRLVRVALSLDDVARGAVPALPPLASADDGYVVTSLPEDLADRVGERGLLRFVRQRYVRYHVDLAGGRAAWLAGLSANTRAGIKRKAKRVAAASGGAIDVRRYRTPAEIAAFHPIARRVSARTYQERLLDAGLPADPAGLMALAEADAVRAWLLFVGGVPAAYLACTAQGLSLRYDHVGHDPAFADLSPGAVLQAAALDDLFDDRFARFDFTEGEGQHKRGLASAGTRCVDLLLLRPTLANRAAILAVAGFDGAMARAKPWAAHPLLARAAKQVRR